MKNELKRLKGSSTESYLYAVVHDRRQFVFSMVFADGSSLNSEGSVKPEDCKRLREIFEELMRLSRKD